MFISEVLATARETGGIITAPETSDRALKKAVENLESMGLALPSEYQNFLKETNGLYWGGLEFFGTEVTQKDGGCITDLATQNTFYQKLNKKGAPLFLGRSDEENFLYDAQQKKYLIVDEFSKEEAKAFSLFEQMFEYLMMEQNELIQNCVGFAPEEEPQEDDEALENGLIDMHFFK